MWRVDVSAPRRPMRARSLVAVTAWCYALPASLTAATGKTIAVYADAITKSDPPPGWHLAWNRHGAVSDPANCALLPRIVIKRGRREKHAYGVPDGAGGVATDRPRFTPGGGVYAVRSPDGRSLYAVAAYAMQNDAPGDVWINHRNLRIGGSSRCALEVYLNDQLQFEAAADGGRVPLLFRTRLGRLNKGDVIRVAIGPGRDAERTGGRLCFVIEQVPAGAEADEPANILAPPIDEAAPKRDYDGSHRSYLSKHEPQCREVIEKQPQLVFLGDSITSRLPQPMLEERYGKYRPVNLGIGGDWTQNVLWRVQHGVLDQAPVKTVVLLIGTNNIANGFAPDEIARGIGRIVGAAHDKAPASKVLVLGIFPRGRSAPDSRANRLVRQVNAKLAEMADGKKAFFLDVGDKLTEADGTVSKQIMPDGLHVAGPGFERWLDAMDPTLRQLLAERGRAGVRHAGFWSGDFI